MFALHFLPSSQSQSCFLFFAIPHIRHTIIIIARSLTRKAAELCHCVSYTLTQLLTCAHSNCISQRENERGEMNLEKVKFTHQPRVITDHWSALDIKPDNEDPWWSWYWWQLSSNSTTLTTMLRTYSMLFTSLKMRLINWTKTDKNGPLSEEIRERKRKIPTSN